jgi:hypothetical protein
MEYTEEIKETLIKINDFIQANNDVNYRIRLLEREVPNLQELVKKLGLHIVSKSLPSDIEIGEAMSKLSEIADKESER